MRVRVSKDILMVDPATGEACVSNTWDGRFLRVGTNVARGVQVADVDVDSRPCLLALPPEPRLSDEEWTVVSRALRDRLDGPIARVTEHSLGKAVLVSETIGCDSLFAAAAATVRASWAWDEVENFDIVINGTRHRVAAAFIDGIWTVTPEPTENVLAP